MLQPSGLQQGLLPKAKSTIATKSGPALEGGSWQTQKVILARKTTITMVQKPRLPGLSPNLTGGAADEQQSPGCHQLREHMMTTAQLVIEQGASFGGRKWMGFKLPRSKTDAGPRPSSPPLQDRLPKAGSGDGVPCFVSARKFRTSCAFHNDLPTWLTCISEGK